MRGKSFRRWRGGALGAFAALAGLALWVPAWRARAASEAAVAAYRRALSSGQPVLLEFTSFGRTDCDTLRQRIQALAPTWGSRLVLVRIEVDTNEGATLAEAYGASPLPHLLFIDAEGRVVSRLAGLIPEATLRECADAVIRAPAVPRPRPSCCGPDEICGKP